MKKEVKYLGIHITKDGAEREKVNFVPKLKKLNNIKCMSTKRQVHLGRSLLTKAEGVSRFVYPALSLEVSEDTCKEINQLLIDFR